jgi:hypothetical protein
MDYSTSEIRIVPQLPSGQDALTEILRQGAQKMLAQAVETEVAGWIEGHQHCRDEQDHRQVVRNGYLPERTITSGVGEILSIVVDDDSQAASSFFSPSTKTTPAITSASSPDPFKTRQRFEADSISL